MKLSIRIHYIYTFLYSHIHNNQDHVAGMDKPANITGGAPPGAMPCFHKLDPEPAVGRD